MILGCAGMGGLYRPISAAEAHAALEAAWELGVRSFDTAPYYGAGQSEEFLGAFLRTKAREEFTLSTKIGRLLHDDPAVEDGADGFYGAPKRAHRRDYSAAGVRRSLEESLERLGLDRVDVLLVHDPEEHMPQALGEAAPALAALRDEGIIRAWGVGTNHADVAERFVREAGAQIVLIAGRYTLLDRRAESGLLAACAEHDAEVLAAGVLNSGLLVDPQPGAPYNYAAAPEWILQAAQRMAHACERHGLSLRAAALQFPSRHPAVTETVTGADRAETIRDTVAEMSTEIPAELWDELDALIPEQDRLP